jgi:hypothetical protein
MAKVICERPRCRGDGGYKARAHRRRLNRIDGETDLRGEPMRRHHQEAFRAKGLSLHLAPVKRFLASAVGRPWDKVYGEICAVMMKTSTVQQRLFLRLLAHKVEFHSFTIDGIPHTVIGNGRTRELGDGQLYVSEHGILRRHKRHPSRF